MQKQRKILFKNWDCWTFNSLCFICMQIKRCCSPPGGSPNLSCSDRRGVRSSEVRDVLPQRVLLLVQSKWHESAHRASPCKLISTCTANEADRAPSSCLCLSALLSRWQPQERSHNIGLCVAKQGLMRQRWLSFLFAQKRCYVKWETRIR